jgi:hypothetical protein
MLNRQIALNIQLAGIKTSDTVSMRLFEHWISLGTENVDAQLLQDAFQPHWQELWSQAGLVIPFPVSPPTTAPSVASKALAQKVWLAISIQGLPSVDIGAVEFIKVQQPVGFENQQNSVTNHFYNLKGLFLVNDGLRNFHDEIVFCSDWGGALPLEYDTLKLSIEVAHDG